MTEELQGATAGSSETDTAPKWLQAVLDNQNQQTRHLQMMLAPVLTHITGGNPAAHQASPPLATVRGSEDVTSQHPARDRHAPEPDVTPLVPWETTARPRDHSPFAVEL